MSFKLKRVLLITIMVLAASIAVHARSWDDLDEGETEVYGSEKDSKYPINALFVEKEDWEGHYALEIFWLYKYTDYPKYKSTRVLPFYYNLTSKIDNRSLTAYPLFLSWFSTDGNTASSNILYPLYSSSVYTGGYDRSMLFLFRWGHDEARSYSESYSTFVPLYYYHGLKGTNYSENSFLSPLFCFFDEKKRGKNSYTWWMPIVPLTYHSVDRHGGHRNILWLLDYSWETRGGKDELRRFWLLPLFLWSNENGGYTSFLFPLIYKSGYGDKSWYFHFLPFYGGSFSNNGSMGGVRQDISPLFVRRTVRHPDTGEIVYNNFFFPVIPLFFRSTDVNEGTHTNMLGLVDWRSSAESKLKRFWFIPFAFYEVGEGGYRYFLPFYGRPSGNTEELGYSWGLFHYHSWSPDEKVVWSWPYYSRQTAGKDAESNTYYTHLIPFYWSWKSRESAGRAVFPLYLNYKDENTDLHVNILGLSTKTFTGIFSPSMSAGIGKGQYGWYADYDFSWLYNVFCFSTRVPLEKESISVPGNTKLAETSFAGDKQKKPDTMRELSRFYWGWDVLFGWMSYRHADTTRHFRMLPLTWLTWDSRSSDRLYVLLPFFLSYKSGDSEYFAVAPFYASQKDGKSWRRGYLVNLYWDEYSAAEEKRERTVLWPFINCYRSPLASGGRFFPLFWTKTERKEADGPESGYTLMLPLFYHSFADRSSYTNVLGLFNNWSSPDESSTLFLPFYYYRSSPQGSRLNIIGLFDFHFSTGDENSDISILPFFSRKRAGDYRSTTIYPLFTHFSSGADWNKRFVLGTYWYSSPDYSRQNFLYLFDRKKISRGEYNRTELSFLLKTVDYSIEPDIIKFRLFWGGLFEFDRSRKSGSYDADAFMYLAGVSKREGYLHHRLLPLYAYTSEAGEGWDLYLPPLLSYFGEDREGELSLGCLGLLYYRNTDVTAGEASRKVLLGALYEESERKERSYRSYGSLWGLLWKYETEEKGYSKFSILKGLYKRKTKDGTTENTFLWFI